MIREETILPGKWTVSAKGRRMVVRKRPIERQVHVYMKIFIWALYLDQYPALEIAPAGMVDDQCGSSISLGIQYHDLADDISIAAEIQPHPRSSEQNDDDPCDP